MSRLNATSWSMYRGLSKRIWARTAVPKPANSVAPALVAMGSPIVVVDGINIEVRDS